MTATASQVGGTTFTTPTDREIVMTFAVDAPRERVWDAYTAPEHLPRWMLGMGDWTMDLCEVDLRPGGAWRFGWRHDRCGAMRTGGEYREVAAPERLVSTESWGGDWPETLNTLALAEQDGGTTITKTMLYPSREARDAALGTGMKEGVAQSFRRLAEYLRATA